MSGVFFSIKISDINRGLSNIIERFILEVDQFYTKHIYLIEWLEVNTIEIEKDFQLSTLNNDHDRLKKILNKGIQLQNDLKSLQEYLQTIDLIIKDFEQAIENTDDEKLTNILKRFYQDFELLARRSSDFIKHCKQISDYCERYLILFNEMNHLNEELLKSMNEFDEHLSLNEKNPKVKKFSRKIFLFLCFIQNDNTLQILLLNIQQQLDKLNMLAIHESTSPTNTHFQNQIKEHVSNDFKKRRNQEIIHS
jgi:hypothetical protein